MQIADPSLMTHFRGLVATGSESLTDAELVRRFAEDSDAAAFEVLVWRHGPMVWATCRRILRNLHDVEDAFQAVFLALARKAATLGTRQAVGGWLHRVAINAALKLKADRITTGLVSEIAVLGEADNEELAGIVDEELDRLPERLRSAFILCCLEGVTSAVAARELGCPVGTVDSRLHAARVRLRDRLTRRGFGPAVIPGVVATALSASTVTAAVKIGMGFDKRAAVTALADFLSRITTNGAISMKLVLAAGLAVAFVGVVWALGGAEHAPPPAATKAAPAQRTQISDGPPLTTPRAILHPDKAGQTYIVGRLTVNHHAMKQDCQVFSVGVEVDNLTAREAMLQFDPKDLKLELLDADGKVIEESPTVRSGPAPIAHKATIPTSGYVGISTYRGGIGLTPKSILLAAGLQAWVLKPGTYRVRGTATVSVTFGGEVLDPEKPDTPESKPKNAPYMFKLELIECRFELKREQNAPDR